MFKHPVVESQRGGQKGGGAVLTAFGEELLNRFRHMEQTIRATLAADLDWLEANRQP
jgi:molybdate transport system regulatory protein